MKFKITENDNKLVYSVKEARALLGVGRDQVYRAVKAGEIPHLRLGARIVVPKAALHRLLDGEIISAPPDIAEQRKPIGRTARKQRG